MVKELERKLYFFNHCFCSQTPKLEFSKEKSKKLFCEEELEDKENMQINSDSTNKYKRKWNLGGSSRNTSQMGGMSVPNSSYQHSLVKNKVGEGVQQHTNSAHQTSLGDIPELSFTKCDIDLDFKISKNTNKQSLLTEEDNKIFIVNRDRQTPQNTDGTYAHFLNFIELEINLLSNEELND